MDPVANFGTITNFVISVAVTLYGLIAWLRDRNLRGGAELPPPCLSLLVGVLVLLGFRLGRFTNCCRYGEP
jgi:hypothetical protein